MSIDRLPPIAPVGSTPVRNDLIGDPAPAAVPEPAPPPSDLPFVLELPEGYADFHREFAAPAEQALPHTLQTESFDPAAAPDEADDEPVENMSELDPNESAGEDAALDVSDGADDATVDADGSGGDAGEPGDGDPDDTESGSDGDAGDDPGDSPGRDGESDSDERRSDEETVFDEERDLATHGDASGDRSHGTEVGRGAYDSMDTMEQGPASNHPAEWAKDPASGALRAAVVGAGLVVAGELAVEQGRRDRSRREGPGNLTQNASDAARLGRARRRVAAEHATAHMSQEAGRQSDDENVQARNASLSPETSDTQSDDDVEEINARVRAARTPYV
jgi:hypothetical protein